MVPTIHVATSGQPELPCYKAKAVRVTIKSMVRLVRMLEMARSCSDGLGRPLMCSLEIEMRRQLQQVRATVTEQSGQWELVIQQSVHKAAYELMTAKGLLKSVEQRHKVRLHWERFLTDLAILESAWRDVQRLEVTQQHVHLQASTVIETAHVVARAVMGGIDVLKACDEVLHRCASVPENTFVMRRENQPYLQCGEMRKTKGRGRPIKLSLRRGMREE